MPHSVTWFDIPVRDLDRAVRFYEAVLGVTIERESHGDFEVGVLPHEGDEVGGCLHPGPTMTPAEGGPLLYLNVDGRMDAALEAVVAHGGRVTRKKHEIGPYGYRAIVVDSEGNRMALHAAS